MGPRRYSTAVPTPTPLLIAHRGESYLAPENTLAALDLAWRLGAAAAEIDVHLTADGQIVLIHDADTARTAGERLVVRDSTLAQLRALDVGRWKGEAWAGERIATLDGALSRLPLGKRLFIEVKVGPEAVPALAAVLERTATPADAVTVISFNPATVAATRERIPDVETYLLSDFRQDPATQGWSPTADELIAAARTCGAHGLDLCARPPLDAAMVRRVRDAGLALCAWTIDDPGHARALIDMGVPGITTNRAAWLRDRLGSVVPCHRLLAGES